MDPAFDKTTHSPLIGDEAPPEAPNDQPDAYIGTVIGDRYEVVSRLGAGGMGTVYKVRHRQLKKFMALKLLPIGKEGIDRTLLARFNAEAKAASDLHHPNLAGIHDFGTTTSGAPYLVMDFIEGETLSDLIERNGPLEQNAALDIFLQVCDGLIYAHSKGIVHRDIKPSNIMLANEKGKTIARVVDFGIAKTLEAPEQQNATLTKTGEVLGSPPYMSPEQCLGAQIDSRTDIYSLGCALFEALTGVRPFAGDTVMATIFKHINERPPLFKAVAPQVKISNTVERVVLQMLEKEPENRYQTITDLKRDMELVRQGKNPVKEMSQLRRNLEFYAKAGKFVVLIFGTVFVTLYLVFYVFWPMMQTPWGKIAAQARQQMSIGPYNYAQAEGYYHQALKAADEHNAPVDEKASLLIELSRVQGFLHEQDAQLKTLKKALSLPGLNPNGANAGYILDELAQYDLDVEDYAQAEKDAREAVKIKTSNFGRINWFTGHSVSRLASALRKQKRYDEADKTCRELVDIETHLFPKSDNIEVADAYFRLANVLADEQSPEEALSWASKGLKVRITVNSPDNPETQELFKWWTQYARHHQLDKQAQDLEMIMQ